MNNKTKIILTVIGLAAIIIPAILLVVFSGKGASNQTTLPSGTRQIDKGTIQKGTQPDPAQTIVASPSPVVVSPSPIIKNSPTPNLQSTPSGVN